MHIAAWIWLVLGFATAAVISIDEMQHRQKMWIMMIVWPVTALYFGPFALWLYRRTRPMMRKGAQMSEVSEQQRSAPPTPTQTGVAAFHCGAGCTLGDIIAETFVFRVGASFFFGKFGTELLLDLMLAYLLGIAFQYFTIAPMRNLNFREGLMAAFKADTVSILAFELGLFAWMALSHYVYFHPPLEANQASFWFMMQVGMIIGWGTAYPANAWLIRRGLKEKMPQMDPKQNAVLRQPAA